MVARLKALSERLDRLRRQAQEVHALASDEVKAAYTNELTHEITAPPKGGVNRLG